MQLLSFPLKIISMENQLKKNKKKKKQLNKF